MFTFFEFLERLNEQVVKCPNQTCGAQFDSGVYALKPGTKCPKCKSWLVQPGVVGGDSDNRPTPFGTDAKMANRGY